MPRTQRDYWQVAHDAVMEEMNKKHSDWQTDRLPTDFYTIQSGTGYSTATEHNTITCLAGGAEMLRVTPEGFWVRGKKVKQDDNEAQAVYNAFKAWMTWATLNKDYK